MFVVPLVVLVLTGAGEDTFAVVGINAGTIAGASVLVTLTTTDVDSGISSAITVNMDCHDR